ncbi:MAG: polyphosphate kinase 1 [Luteibaculaceae bacterium]
MPLRKIPLLNRELSWMYFNERVLQESEDPIVPIIERLRFLGIFSNNLDEFYKVRVATLRRMALLGKKASPFYSDNPKDILLKIRALNLKFQARFEKNYQKILEELAQEHIYFLDENQISEEKSDFVKNYFKENVRSSLVPIILQNKGAFPELEEGEVYLAIKLYNKVEGDLKLMQYALIKIPSDDTPRIVVLPEDESGKYFMMIDDIIRYNLHQIFSLFGFDTIEAYTVKVTRDAELDVAEDLSLSLLEKLSQSLKDRKKGSPVRFIYDSKMPQDLLDFLLKKLNFKEEGNNLIPGGKFHNFKDFLSFPSLGNASWLYKVLKPLSHPDFEGKNSYLEVIKQKDVLLNFPFQKFDYVIDILREAAIDPNVKSIKINLYRVSKKSKIINALINAARNGKEVTAVIELRARFDEKNNIKWSKTLEDEGIKVDFGVQGLKVHSKMMLIERKNGLKREKYAYIGTGNFHEGTARIYTDVALLTANPIISSEVEKVFNFIKDNYRREIFRELIVSPFNFRRRFNALINFEINQAKKGNRAEIILKLNNLVDEAMIKKLYDASNAGVKIQLIVRGICCLIPGVKGYSENIKVISIIDRFLEHSRIYWFYHGGKDKIFISSADWMTRNIDRRVEVTVPILDNDIKQHLVQILDIQLKDNVKARIIDHEMSNQYLRAKSGEKIRSQIVTYGYYQKLLENKNKEI